MSAPKTAFSTMYFPGLPANAEIKKAIFMRRKPHGFSTSHALLVSGHYANATRLRLISSWVGAFSIFSGIVIYQQAKMKAWKLPFSN